MKRIAFNEDFHMYICLPYRNADNLALALASEKFVFLNEDRGDEHMITVTVNPSRVAILLKLMKKHAH